MNKFFWHDYNENNQEEYFGLLLNDEFDCANYKDLGKKRICWYQRLLDPRATQPSKEYENGKIYPYKVGEICNIFNDIDKVEIEQEIEPTDKWWSGHNPYSRLPKYNVFHYKAIDLDKPKYEAIKRFCTVSVVGYTKIRDILEKEINDYIKYISKIQKGSFASVEFNSFKVESNINAYHPLIHLIVTPTKIAEYVDFPVKYKIDKNMNIKFDHPEVPTLRNKWDYLHRLTDILDILTYAMDNYNNDKKLDYKIVYDKKEFIYNR